MKTELLDKVLKQIVKDVEAGDVTAIAELIADIPDKQAMHFLPEEIEDESLQILDVQHRQ